MFMQIFIKIIVKNIFFKISGNSCKENLNNINNKNNKMKK